MAKVTMEDTQLVWQTFEGSLPNGAVSIYNEYYKRTDYVAKFGIEAGFYNPDMGAKCHYPYAGKEHLGSPFEILVNKDGIESLEWKYGSYGSVPPNSVYSNPNEIYVGKNMFGLGKVHVDHKSFYLPREGKEYRYDYYQVLTFKPEVIKEHISDVKYNTHGVKIIQCPLETLKKSVVTNNTDNPVTQTATLSETTETEQRWDTSCSLTAGVPTSISAGIPEIDSADITFRVETTLQLSEGTTHIESTTHSVALECKVPPNSSCTVNWVVHKYKADIPYTASLQRTYKNGKTKSTSITGTYRGVKVGEVRGVMNH